MNQHMLSASAVPMLSAETQPGVGAHLWHSGKLGCSTSKTLTSQNACDQITALFDVVTAKVCAAYTHVLYDKSSAPLSLRWLFPEPLT